MNYNIHKTRLYLLAATSLVVLNGCTFIPNLPGFDNPVPSSYPEGKAYNAAIMNNTGETPTLAQTAWQNYFQDDKLKSLISIGLENNRDLKLAALNIAEAQALYGIERSAIFPDINATGSYTRQKTPNVPSANIANNTPTGGAIVESYSAGLGISSYEIDLFGRVRSLSESALNEYFATEAAQDSVRISLIANIATSYTDLMANRALLKLAEETVQAQQESYDIISLRATEGIASDLDLRQAEILLHQARADQFQFLYAATQSLNGLRLLLGTPDTMQDIMNLIPENVSIDSLGNFVADVPAGLPAELLTNRPDIAQAEYLLKSANANIGAARAAFFPSISLTTNGGYASGELSGLFSGGTQFWQFAPQINLPVFTGGRLKNSLDFAEIRRDAAVIEYEQTIEVAFREVMDSLAAVSTYVDRIAAQQDLIRATESAADLSRLRFDTGVENYLSVLDAERALYGARQNYIQQKAAQINAKIDLYRSVGGGI